MMIMIILNIISILSTWWEYEPGPLLWMVSAWGAGVWENQTGHPQDRSTPKKFTLPQNPTTKPPKTAIIKSITCGQLLLENRAKVTQCCLSASRQATARDQPAPTKTGRADFAQPGVAILPAWLVGAHRHHIIIVTLLMSSSSSLLPSYRCYLLSSPAELNPPDLATSQ